MMATKITDVDRGHGAAGEPPTGQESSPPFETPPVPDTKAEPKHRRKQGGVTSLFGTKTKASLPTSLPGKPKPKVELSKADNTEGLAMLYSKLGDVVEDREKAAGGLGGIGRAMRFTAPTAGRLLADGVKRFPGLHNLLGVLIGTGASARDASAVISIPIQMHRIEGSLSRGEFGTVLEQMRLVRVQMRPILLDMVRAAKEEAKMLAELAKLEKELGEFEGRPFDLNHMILVDMLGLHPEWADDILNGMPNREIWNKWIGPNVPQPEEPAPQEEASVA